VSSEQAAHVCDKGDAALYGLADRHRNQRGLPQLGDVDRSAVSRDILQQHDPAVFAAVAEVLRLSSRSPAILRSPASGAVLQLRWFGGVSGLSPRDPSSCSRSHFLNLYVAVFPVFVVGEAAGGDHVLSSIGVDAW
jgi:hypothetical protein